MTPRPMLRGWVHALAVLPAAMAAIWLGMANAADPPRFLAFTVYGISLVALYAVSATLHLVSWQGSWYRFWRGLDHANIFAMIAGTYTPIVAVVLSGWERVAILSLIWTLGLTGMAITTFAPRIGRPVRSGLYIGMGWVAVLSFPSLAAALPWQALALMLVGGLCYTIGAIVYSRRSPDPLPRIFGYHEVFHVLTIAGGASFLGVIWWWVLPFRPV